MHPSPLGSAGPSVAAAVEAMLLQVNRENVLQARNVLLGEVDRLREAIREHVYFTEVGLCGGDPVSEDAAPAFNERIGALAQHCWQYTFDLEDAAARLADAARSYGFTEEQIAAAFSATPPSPPAR